jgi:hypothetical protein
MESKKEKAPKAPEVKKDDWKQQIIFNSDSGEQLIQLMLAL